MTKKYNYIKKTGRPTKYIPEIIFPKVEEYITSCGRENTALPTVEGLAISLDVTTETIYQWTKEHLEFSDTIKRIANRQKEQLLNDGMYGGKEVNAAMAIFLLKANHGLKDNEGQVNIQVNVTPIVDLEAK